MELAYARDNPVRSLARNGTNETNKSKRLRVFSKALAMQLLVFCRPTKESLSESRWNLPFSSINPLQRLGIPARP